MITTYPQMDLWKWPPPRQAKRNHHSLLPPCPWIGFHLGQLGKSGPKIQGPTFFEWIFFLGGGDSHFFNPPPTLFFQLFFFFFFGGGVGKQKTRKDTRASCMKFQWRRWWQHHMQSYYMLLCHVHELCAPPKTRASYPPQKCPIQISGRVPIGSCDFSLYNWSCGEIKEDDWDLKGFSIKRYEDSESNASKVGIWSCLNFT